MAQIKINNIIYGTSDATEIMYNNITVAEKLDTVPIFDIEDNTDVSEIESNYLTYGHIINGLNSDATDKVLSANQGRILDEKINNLDSNIKNNTTSLSNVQGAIDEINNNIIITDNKVNDLNKNSSDIYNIINKANIGKVRFLIKNRTDGNEFVTFPDIDTTSYFAFIITETGNILIPDIIISSSYFHFSWKAGIGNVAMVIILAYN